MTTEPEDTQPKRYLGGIRDASGLKNRSRLEEGGCWQWLGAVDKYGRAKVWFEPFGCTTTIPPVIGFLRTGRRPPRSERWLPCCGSERCVNPEHWKRSTHSAAVKARPFKAPELHALKTAAGRRAKSKWTEEDITFIRECRASIRVCAAQFGMSKSQVCRIRRGEARRPIVAPSIFNGG